MKYRKQLQATFFIQIVLTMVLCFALQYFLPWWTLAIGAFISAFLMNNKGFVSFLAGVIAAGLLWFVMALTIDLSTGSILTQKVNQLLPLNTFVLTTLIGALVGGFASLSGSLTRRLL